LGSGEKKKITDFNKNVIFVVKRTDLSLSQKKTLVILNAVD
jgi:hypothetical protein